MSISSVAGYADNTGIITVAGKYYTVSTLNNSLGQFMNGESNSFYVSDSPILISFSLDKKAYKPGEQINITGEIKNSSTDSFTGLTFNLKKNDDVILTQTFDLTGNEVRTFTASTSGQSGFNLSAGIGLNIITEKVIVENPSIEVSILAPDSTGQDPFVFSGVLKNTSSTDVTLNLDITGEGLSDTLSTTGITISSGNSYVFTKTFSIIKDTIFNVTLTGDIEKTTQKLVAFGEKINFTVQPEALYSSGPVSILYKAINIGLLDSQFNITFKINGMTETKWAYVPKSGEIIDYYTPDLPEGDYVLTYETIFGTGQANITVRNYNKVSITNLNLTSVSIKSAEFALTVKNSGLNVFKGNLMLSTSFQDKQTSLELNPSEEKTLSYIFDVLDGVSPGDYNLKAQVMSGTDVVNETTLAFNLAPSFALSEIPQNLSFNAGSAAVVPLMVKNSGPVAGFTNVSFNSEDFINSFYAVKLLSGEEATVNFGFNISDDLLSKDYIGLAKVNNVEYNIPFSVKGYGINVTNSLDKVSYAEGETAVFTVKVLSVNELSPAGYVTVKFGDYEEKTAVMQFSGTETPVIFNIPVHFTANKLSFGVYLESGRALYLNSLYIYKKGEEVAITMNKQVYNSGEAITVSASSLVSGVLEITAPNYQNTFNVTSSTHLNFQFNLPQEMVTGNYYISYAFLPEGAAEKSYGSAVFDVIGYTVKYVEAALDKAFYYPGNNIALKLKINSNRNIAGCTLNPSIFDGFPIGASGFDLATGDNSVTINGVVPSNITGGTGNIYYELKKGTLGLTTGIQSIEIKLPDALPPVSSVLPSGDLYNNGQANFAPASFTYSIFSIDDGVPPSGVDYSSVKVNGADWLTYTTPISFIAAGEQVIRYKSVDKAGNWETEKEFRVTIDNAASVSNLNIGIPQYVLGDNTWVTTETLINLAATDSGSGVNKIEYNINGGDWLIYSVPFKLSLSSSNVISYRSIDNVGNIETTKTKTLYVDIAPPASIIDVSEPKVVEVDKLIVFKETNFTLTAVDTGSGVKEIKYKIDSEDYRIYTNQFNLANYAQGGHLITYYSVDNIGNVEVEKTLAVTLRVDSTPPVSSISLGIPSYNDYVNSSTGITITSTDDSSKLAKIYYTIDNGSINVIANTSETIVFSTSILLNNPGLADGKHFLAYYAEDALGNIEIAKLKEVYLDNTPSVSSISIGQPQYSGVSPLLVSSGTAFTLTSIDSGSGSLRNEYSIDNGWSTANIFNIPISTADGVHGVNYRSLDNLLNTELSRTVSITLDNTAPAAKITSPVNNEYVNGIVSVIGMATDTNFDNYILEYGAGETPATWFAIKTSSLQVPEGGELGKWDTAGLSEGIYTLRLTAVDKVLNSRIETVKVTIMTFKFLLAIYDRLSHPDKIAVDKDGYIYAADRENDCIKVLDHKGNSISIGKGILNKPEGIALDSNENIYAGSRNTSVIEKFNSNGNHIATLGQGFFNKVCGLKVDETGKIIAADRNQNVIRILNPDGTLFNTIGAGQLNKPEDVDIWKDESGNIYYFVANRNQDNIKVFNGQGVLVKTIDCSKTLTKPDGVVVNASGDVIVADSNNNRVVKLDVAGNIKLTISFADGLNFNHPKGVCFDTLGNLYIADSMNKRIVVFGTKLPEVPDLPPEQELVKKKEEKQKENQNKPEWQKQIEERQTQSEKEKEKWETKEGKEARKAEETKKENKKRPKWKDEADRTDKENRGSKDSKESKKGKEDKKINIAYTYTEIKDQNTGEVIWNSMKDHNNGQFKDHRPGNDSQGASTGSGQGKDKGNSGKNENNGNDKDADKEKGNNGQGNGKEKDKDKNKGKGKKSSPFETEEIKSPMFEIQKF